jgi:hypothetical protein
MAKDMQAPVNTEQLKDNIINHLKLQPMPDRLIISTTPLCQSHYNRSSGWCRRVKMSRLPNILPQQPFYYITYNSFLRCINMCIK